MSIFNITGFFKKIFLRKKTTDEMKMDIFKKATEHLDSHSHLSDMTGDSTKKSKAFKKKVDPDKRQNIKYILIILANSGETGVLSKSISDDMRIDPMETKNALNYLVGKKYAEVINGALGEKYYLSELGRRYCVNKKYIV